MLVTAQFTEYIYHHTFSQGFKNPGHQNTTASGYFVVVPCISKGE